MTQIDKIYREIREYAPYLEFCEILMMAREKIGIKLYRASLHSRIPMGRLKRLESGLFRKLPEEYELRNLSEIYGLDFYMLKKKAQKYIEETSTLSMAEQLRGKLKIMQDVS